MSLDSDAPAQPRVAPGPVSVDRLDVTDRPDVVDLSVVLDPRPATERPPITPEAADDVIEAVRRSLAVECGAVRAWSRWELSVPVQDFVRAAVRHRVVGIIASHGTGAGLDPAACALLRPAIGPWALEGTSLVAETAQVQQLLNEARVPSLVYQGAPLSVLTTGRGEARGGGDVDVLVEAGDVPAAHQALTAAGWRARPDGTPTPGQGPAWGWARFVGRQRSYDGEHRPVDLHWRIGPGTALFAPVATLLGRAVSVQVGGTPVRTLAAPDALVAACLNAADDELSSARQLLDVARLLRLVGPDDPAGTPPSARRLVRDVSGLVAELLGPVGPRHGGTRNGPAALQARWATGSVWAADSKRRGPVASVRPTRGNRLARLGQGMALEPTPASWARLVGLAVLPASLLADGATASPWRTVLGRTCHRAVAGCLRH